MNALSHTYALPEGAHVSGRISIGREKSSDVESSGSEYNSESDTSGEDGDALAESLTLCGDDDVGKSPEGVEQPSLEVVHPMRGRFKNFNMIDIHQREEEYFFVSKVFMRCLAVSPCLNSKYGNTKCRCLIAVTKNEDTLDEVLRLMFCHASQSNVTRISVVKYWIRTSQALVKSWKQGNK